MRQNGIRYSTVAIVLHWAIAALILSNLATGFVMEGLSRPLKAMVIPFHFSCGMTVLALTALRVLWRVTHKPPSLSPGLRPWERMAAHGAHTLLCVLMVAMPLIGWSIISAHPPRAEGAAQIWGFLRLPALSPISQLAGPASKVAHAVFVNAHLTGGWILVGLLVLHIAGALKHQWIDREPQLARMGIGRAERGRAVIGRS
jgi:cytochrome b561